MNVLNNEVILILMLFVIVITVQAVYQI